LTFLPSYRPVPDVYEALIKSFVGAGKTVEEAQAHIEHLKEQERYILEVYVSFSLAHSRRGPR
jgi:sulfite reductase alpha subunit-like flavoprotein